MKREFLQGLMDMPKEVLDAIMAENGRDIQQAKQDALLWQDKYQQAMAENEKAMEDLRFDAALQAAIWEARGRNAKAIAALLDVEALKKDPAAVREAVQELKKDCAYLFDAAPTPPPYAGGTGARGEDIRSPATLAEALRERFEKR